MLRHRAVLGHPRRLILGDESVGGFEEGRIGLDHLDVGLLDRVHRGGRQLVGPAVGQVEVSRARLRRRPTPFSSSESESQVDLATVKFEVT